MRKRFSWQRSPTLQMLALTCALIVVSMLVLVAAVTAVGAVMAP